MKYTIPIFILAISLNSCRKLYVKHFVSDEQWQIEHDYVDSCESKWNYLNLTDTTSIVVLWYKNQWGHGTAHFPSFFIGIDNYSDTIGIIEYEFDGEIEIGDTISFSSGHSRYAEEKGKNGHFPSLPRSYIREHNLIYCSVKNVYYANIINKNAPQH